MWRLVAGFYCLIVATLHPEAEAWARLPPAERAEAEKTDPDGLLCLRKWYDGLLRPVEGDDGLETSKMAMRFLSWETAEAFFDKIEWLNTEQGRKLVRRVWRDAKRQPYGFVNLV